MLCAFLASSRYLIFSPLLNCRGVAFFDAIVHRVVMEGHYSLSHIFEAMSRTDFFWGETYAWDLMAKLPGEQVGLQGWLFLQNNADAYYIKALTPTLVGELFVNFGWFSPFLYGLFGAFLAITDSIIGRKIMQDPSTPMLVIYCALLMFAAKSATSGLEIFGVVVSIVFFATCYFFYTLLPRKLRF